MEQSGDTLLSPENNHKATASVSIRQLEKVLRCWSIATGKRHEIWGAPRSCLLLKICFPGSAIAGIFPWQNEWHTLVCTIHDSTQIFPENFVK